MAGEFQNLGVSVKTRYKGGSMKKKKSKKVHKGETAQEQFKALMKGEKNKK